MKKRASLDEIVARRKVSARDDGALFKAIVFDGDEIKGFNSESRSQRFVMSSENPDRYKDVVRQEGLSIDQFVKNPVGLAFHNHGSPIGWWSDVKKVNGRPKRTEGILTLHPEGTTDAVDEIGRLLSAGAIKACSIGFMPTEAEWIFDDEGHNTYGIDFIASELLECSVCSIPANPDALAKMAGGDVKMAVELFERFLDTFCERTAGGLLVRKEFEDEYARLKKTDEKPKVAETITVKLEVDSEEAERQIDGIFARFQKKFSDLFASASEPKVEPVVDKWAEYETPIEFAVDDAGVHLVGEWPQKTMMTTFDDETLKPECASVDGDIITFKTAEAVATYKIGGLNAIYRYLDLIEVKAIEPAPVLVPHSRAKAKAKTADLMGRLRVQGLVN